MDFRARIQITLKPSIFDPAGAAVESSLHQLGHDQVAQVRLGKLISLTLSAPSPEAAHRQVIQMCEQLLANPVIERYAIEITDHAIPQTLVTTSSATSLATSLEGKAG